MNKSPKTMQEQRAEILRRAREAQQLGNQQAVKECRRALETLTGKAR